MSRWLPARSDTRTIGMVYNSSGGNLRPECSVWK